MKRLNGSTRIAWNKARGFYNSRFFSPENLRGFCCPHSSPPLLSSCQNSILASPCPGNYAARILPGIIFGSIAPPRNRIAHTSGFRNRVSEPEEPEKNVERHFARIRRQFRRDGKI